MTLESTLLLLCVIAIVLWITPGFFRSLGVAFGQGIMQGINQQLDEQFATLSKIRTPIKPDIKEN